MSKFLKIPNGDYKIQVQPGGTITLDTGTSQGEVRILGDLRVDGTTTTINSTELTVDDNIIVINEGETTSGIALDYAGIRIDRGLSPDAFILYDDRLVDPVDNVTAPGLFRLGTETGAAGSFTPKGLYTRSISTGGLDLLLDTGAGKVAVDPTSNYEIGLTEDDLTNKKYVDDAITTAFATIFIPQIGDGTVSISSVTVIDEETSAAPSTIEFAIDGIPVTNIYKDRWEFTDIRIVGTKIETLASNEDLILAAPGVGSVRIDDTLHLNSVPGDDDETIYSLSPQTPNDGAKIYVSTQSTGGSGIFFVNQDDTRDEIISRNRALIFSMLF